MIVDAWLATALRGQPVEWDALGVTAARVLATCDALEISELLHHQLTRHPTAASWPIDVRAELGRRARASTARQLVRSAEVTEVLGALDAHGVRPIVFKGAALSHLLYDTPALRPHADTDLLVRRADVSTVRRILSERGYAEPPMTGGELVMCQFQMVKTDRFGVEHVFDVHWKISTQSLFADILTYGEVSDEAVPIEALGSTARGAGGAHALLLACIHPVMHHRNIDRPIWFHDIHLLVSRLPTADLERFGSLAVSKGVSAICARQLALTSECFRTGRTVILPPRSVAANEPSAIYLSARRRWHHELWWNVRSLRRWRDRVRLMREVLLPPPQYMLDSYHLRAPGLLLLPVLYVHRGVHGAVKILTGRK